MYDIENRLNDIIFKYNLDEFYPSYRKSIKAKKILSLIIKDNKENVVFIVQNEEEKNICQCYIKSKIQYVLEKNLQNYTSEYWMNFDKIYIISFDKKKLIKGYFDKIEVRTEWIYDDFLQENLQFEAAFYDDNLLSEKEKKSIDGGFLNIHHWTNCIQMIIFRENKNYLNALNDEIKCIILKKLIFLTIRMKNFKKAKYYFIKLQELDSFCMEYIYAWQEIDCLLNEIKLQLEKRNKKDIIIYWNDSMSYGEETSMPYLSTKIKESIAFSNAFTNTPFTGPTAKSIFCQKMQVDDEAYKIKEIGENNSELIRNIYNANYIFKVLGRHMKYFSDEYFSDMYHEGTDSCSMIYWDMIRNMIMQDKPMVLLAHAMEPHAPFLNMNMNGNVLQDLKESLYHREFAKQELDDQLEFYDSFIPKETVRIYMSDHGVINVEGMIERHHIIFSIWKKDILSKEINYFISTKDIGKIVENIINNSDLLKNINIKSYVKIQDVPRYNSLRVKSCIENVEKRLLPDIFGYKGIIDRDYVYIKFFNEIEYMIKRDKNMIEPKFLLESKVDNKELVSKYRELAGRCPDKLIKDEKFKYSRELLKQGYNQANNLAKGFSYIRSIIDESLRRYPAKSIAIRMGGYHSSVLFELLSLESKNKIKCFIDCNKECECMNLGLPIMTLEESIKEGIKGIILSSFTHLQMLRDESRSYYNKISVIDLYQILEKRGLVCKQDFFLEFMDGNECKIEKAP